MIVADTDVLSAFAKVGAIQLLFDLFRTDNLTITEGVYKEIQYSADAGHAFAKELTSMVDAGKIRVVHLTAEEKKETYTLPDTLGAGERESIVALRRRSGMLLSNESRVKHYCGQFGITCVRIPDILRALWQEGLVSKEEVMRLISDLKDKDRMRFTERTLQAIFIDTA
ncbi:hypothetical protein HRbin16_01544 [bacterium HR16]|nr:hypothetical protein HRbin16_01544 [bacterium HR16]